MVVLAAPLGLPAQRGFAAGLPCFVPLSWLPGPMQKTFGAQPFFLAQREPSLLGTLSRLGDDRVWPVAAGLSGRPGPCGARMCVQGASCPRWPLSQHSCWHKWVQGSLVTSWEQVLPWGLWEALRECPGPRPSGKGRGPPLLLGASSWLCRHWCFVAPSCRGLWRAGY